jgi:hypothetical protein
MVMQQGAECPTCHHFVRAETQLVGPKRSEPHPADLTVCPVCASILWYDKDLELHLMSADEITDLPEPTRAELIRLRQFIKVMVWDD